MKALTEGRYRGRDGIWAVFDLGWDTELRVGILEHDIGRVVMKRARRLSRSIAAGASRPMDSSLPSRGDCATSTEGFTCPEASVVQRDGRSCWKPRA